MTDQAEVFFSDSSGFSMSRAVPDDMRCRSNKTDHAGECAACNAASGEACLMPNPEKMWEALKAIAGTIPWPDNEMGFNDLARSALSPKEGQD